MKTLRLSSGYDMPLVGLGTWQPTPGDVETAVLTALKCGYRHIDTAALYGSEYAVGIALKKWFAKGGKREELFITTKLPMYGNTPSGVEEYIKLSLKNLQLDYIDLYLIHNPFSLMKDPNGDSVLKAEDDSCKLELKGILDSHSRLDFQSRLQWHLNTSLVSVWKAMENQVKNGNVRSIGISNFNENQMKQVWGNAEIKPSNLQIELHAYFQQKHLLKVCRKYNISVTSFSTLGSLGGSILYSKRYVSAKLPNLISHPVVKKIAAAHNKTTAQVLLRHLIEDNIMVIPKSFDPQRIKENIEIFDFELTKDEKNQLDSLGRGVEGRIFDFLFLKGVEKHPDFPFKEELQV